MGKLTTNRRLFSRAMLNYRRVQVVDPFCPKLGTKGSKPQVAESNDTQLLIQSHVDYHPLVPLHIQELMITYLCPIIFADCYKLLPF